MMIDKLLAASATLLCSVFVAIAGAEAVQHIAAAAWSWRHSIERYLTF